MLEGFSKPKLYKTHRLICFGGGKLTQQETERLERLGIPKHRIQIVDGDDEMLSRYFAGATAFIYPSLYEGFGIPLLEAMECGCPVLCGNSSSMPEVAGKAAIYFDAANPEDIAVAMVQVAQSSEDRTHLILKGRERVKEFSWDKCAQETYAVYERLLANQ